MSLAVKHSDVIEKLSGFKFDSSEKLFLLESRSGLSIIFDYVLDVDELFEEKNFEVYLFHRNSYAENDIYQVFDKIESSRIGWIFPIQALQSNSHDYSNNPHFLKYANVAFKLLLRGIDRYIRVTPDYVDRFYKLTDFYHQDSIVLVLCKASLKKTTTSFTSYFLSLFRQGNFHQCDKSFKSNELLERLTNDSSSKIKINLDRSSLDLINDPFILKNFEELLPYEENPTLSFFYQYQLVEYLIEILFREILVELKTNLTSTDDLTKIRDLLETFSKDSKEQKRIQDLINRTIKSTNTTQDLHNACNHLLTITSKETKDTVAKSLYAVRNLIFHNFSRVSDPSSKEVSNISKEFLIVVCEIMMQFK